MSQGTWNPDTKNYKGPDEDGKYYHKSEVKQQRRMVETSNRRSGGGGGEVRELEERRRKFRAMEKKGKSKVNEKVLKDLRDYFKKYDGKDNFLIKISRWDVKHTRGIDITVNNDNITKDRKLSSIIELKVAKNTNVKVHEIEKNSYYILDVHDIHFNSNFMPGDSKDELDTLESDWAEQFESHVHYKTSEATYFSIKIARRDCVEYDRIDKNIAEREISESHFEVPNKKSNRSKNNNNK